MLLSSGVTITYAHRAALVGMRLDLILGLLATLILGFIFCYVQYFEYSNALFSINDSIFGSLFFMLTGFHGLHVIVGAIFLTVCLFRHLAYHFTRFHHIGLECAIWY